MLVGRARERAEIGTLLEGARNGRSAALFLAGEAGIGKSALLDHATHLAAEQDFRILRARGYESESDIPFAGLLDLLSPLLDLRARIPPVQARALGAALALEPPLPHDRFAVPAGVLSLLAAAAEEGPLLAVLDDAHWLDEASREAMLFVARRLDAEGVVLLFGARSEPVEDIAPAGVPLLRVEGLDDESSRSLLAREASVPEAIATRLLRESAGNPLALLEIPGALSPDQLSGITPLPDPLPLGETVHRAFTARVDELPPATRRALVTASAMETGRRDTLHAALIRLGLDPAALEPAEHAQLIRLAEGVEFRHPLLRAAVYHDATDTERRAVHEALAEVVDDPRRRAWHLAIAAVAPDEEVAAALEVAASDARDRGGLAAAAHGFARAAELSTSPGTRARRQVKAASSWAVSGHPDAARVLLEAALPEATDPALLATLRRVRAEVELRSGSPQVAHDLFVAEADRLEAEHPARAARLLLEASVAHLMTGRMDALRVTATRARDLVARGADPRVEAVANAMIGAAFIAEGQIGEGDALLDSCASFLLEGDPLLGTAEIVGYAGHCSVWIERWDRAEAVLGRLLTAARDASAFGLLIYPLSAHAHLDFRRGRWASAYAKAAESVRLARETGQVSPLAHSLAVLAHVEAAMGRTGPALEHGTESVELCRSLNSDAALVYGLGALGLDALAQGRVEQAIEHLTEADGVADALRWMPAIVQFAPDRIEALARAGDSAGARRALNRLAEQAEHAGVSWALAATERCRGMLAASDYDVHFEAAIARHGDDGQPFELARTQLAWGERLRRDRRRAQAREPLTAALETFERLGAEPWAERTRAELRATGGPQRDRSASPIEELSAHELQIALLVAQGMTNREVAAALFLSPKTIEYHLSQIYRKLELRSRTQLATLLAAEVPAKAA